SDGIAQLFTAPGKSITHNVNRRADTLGSKRSSRLSRSKCLKNRAERLNGAQRLNTLNGLTSSTVSCPLPATGEAWSSVTAAVNHPPQGYSRHAAQRSDFAIRVAS